MKKKILVSLFAVLLIFCSVFFISCNVKSEDIKAVETAITELPSVESLKYSDKDLYNSANELFKNLTKEKQEKFDKTLSEKLKDIGDKIDLWDTSINNVTTKINNLPKLQDITLNDVTAVNSAKTAYDSMDSLLKSYVAESVVNKLNSILEKLELIPVNNFLEAIGEIGNVEDVFLIDEVKNSLESAKNIYDNLSASQKENQDVKDKKALMDLLQGEYDRLLECSKINDLVITSGNNIFTDETLILSATFTNKDNLYSCVFSIEDNTIGAKIDDKVFSSVMPGKITLKAKVDFGKSVELETEMEITVKGVEISGQINSIYDVRNGLSVKAKIDTYEVSSAISEDNGLFNYTISVPRNVQIKLLAEADNFESKSIDVNVGSDNITDKNIELNYYKLKPIDNGGNWTFDGNSYKVPAENKDLVFYAGFQNQVKDTWMLETVVSNAETQFTDKNNNIIKCYGILISATPGSKAAIVFSSNDNGVNWRITAMNLSGWGTRALWPVDPTNAWANAPASMSEEINAPYNGGEIKLKVVRKVKEIYLFINDRFIGDCTIGVGENGFKADNGGYPDGSAPHLFGTFTRAGNGATFKNVKIEYSLDKINKEILNNINLTTELGEDDEYGTVNVDESDGKDGKIKLNGFIAIYITPKQSTSTDIYQINEVLVNGVNRVADLSVSDEGINYLFIYNIVSDIDIKVVMNKTQKGLVSGKVTGFEGFDLKKVTKVTVGSQIADFDNVTGEYSVYVPVTDENIIVTAFTKYYVNPVNEIEGGVTTAGKENINLEIKNVIDFVCNDGLNKWVRDENNNFTVSAANKEVQFLEFKNPSNVWMLETTISNCKTNNGEHNYGILLSGKPGQKSSIVLQADNSRICAHYFSGWDNSSFIPDANALTLKDQIMAPYTDGGFIKLKVFRNNQSVYLWVNDVYVGMNNIGTVWKSVNPNETHSFGFFTRSGNGATYSDITILDGEDAINYIKENETCIHKVDYKFNFGTKNDDGTYENGYLIYDESDGVDGFVSDQGIANLRFRPSDETDEYKYEVTKLTLNGASILEDYNKCVAGEASSGFVHVNDKVQGEYMLFLYPVTADLQIEIVIEKIAK